MFELKCIKFILGPIDENARFGRYLSALRVKTKKNLITKVPVTFEVSIVRQFYKNNVRLYLQESSLQRKTQWQNQKQSSHHTKFSDMEKLSGEHN